MGDGVYLVGVGSFEQHGPHLPFETDTLIAEAVALRVAEKTGGELGTTIGVGLSEEHMDFPGTKTLALDEFEQQIMVVVNAHPKAIFINGHGGNNRALRDLGVRHVNLTSMFKPYDHAGEIETSIIMHLRSDLVSSGKICKHEFRWPDKDGWRMKDYSITGVLGDPTAATADKGRAYLDELVEKTVELISRL
ncbi:creatininase family protein [Candidatus Altiarchaeota archaeon]